jgi:transposase
LIHQGESIGDQAYEENRYDAPAPQQLLLNWFEYQGLSSGVVEGFDNKAKLTMRKAYGFKDVETISTALYHQLGNVPEPKRTHKFC